MSFAQRIREIRAGFAPAFWVANFTEIFERLAFYGSSAVLAIYLNEQLHFSPSLTGWLIGIFTGVVYFLPILGGALADRFGFRRSLMFAYLVLTLGYFLLGSLSAPWMESIRHAMGDKWLVLAVLLIPTIGPGLVKPCVAGTTARASAENVRSLGYSIYYTLVNIGGALGPIVAWLVRKKLNLGIENVFRMASCSVFLMFVVTLLFFHEVENPEQFQVRSVGEALKNMVVVLANLRFVAFLLITSGFYIGFGQVYVSMPLFIRGYVDANANPDLIISTEGITVICCQILVTYLSRKMPAVRAIALGFLVSGLSWILLACTRPCRCWWLPSWYSHSVRLPRLRATTNTVRVLLRRASRDFTWGMPFCPSPSGFSLPVRSGDIWCMSLELCCTAPRKCGGWSSGLGFALRR